MNTALVKQTEQTNLRPRNSARRRRAFFVSGRRTEKWYPNGASTRYYWNDDSTQRQIVNRLYNSTLVSQNEYVYDAVGNRKTATEKAGSNTTPFQGQAFGYDPLNNRTYKTDVNTGTNYYIYDAANQLKEIRQTSTTGILIGALVYDDNGNLIRKCEGGTVTTSATTCTGTTISSMSYDVYNRLIQVAKSNENTLSFDYDHQGRRISKNPGAGLPVRSYLYDGDNIYGDYGSWTNPPSYLYVHGPNTDEPLIRLPDGFATPYFYHQDGLGSVVALTIPTGIYQVQLFDAWGNRVTSGGDIPQYGYTGREPDENGLLYYRARHYDPNIGRFLQRDPIGFGGGLNMYAYVKNNPINLTDPTGLWTPLDGWNTYSWDNVATYGIGVGNSLLGLLNNASGVAVGYIEVAAGGAMMTNPATAPAGYMTAGVGYATAVNSGAGIPNDFRNLANALAGTPTQYQNSGSKMLANTFAPGNKHAMAGADMFDLTLAGLSGRVNIGEKLNKKTQGSAFEQWGPGNINSHLDNKASKIGPNASGFTSMWSDTPKSFNSGMIDFFGGSTAVQTSFNNYSSAKDSWNSSGNSGSSWSNTYSPSTIGPGGNSMGGSSFSSYGPYNGGYRW